MKNTFIGILLLVFLASTAHSGPAGKGNGQGARGGGQNARMAHMQENLGLSQEQMEQIRSIRESGGGREEIRAVMTDEQQAKLDEHRANRQGRGGQGNRQGRGNGAGTDQGNPSDVPGNSEG
jgi:Spy/CpxP family protein refolding chaperone